MDTLDLAGETELVRRAQGGDERAFAALVVAHQRFCYNLALQSLSDPREAEDVAQEALVRAWLALPRFRYQARFRTWLYRIVTNLCYSRLPRLRRDLEALGEEDALEMAWEPAADPQAAIQAKEWQTFLHAQIDRLPESQRLIVLLRYREELSYEEIAEVLDVPLGTVKAGLFRARQRLRLALDEYDRVSEQNREPAALAGDWNGR